MFNKITYEDSGVNIDKGNEFVSKIKPLVKSTYDKNVLGNLGSFSGAYALPKGYDEPVLLSATDGVGTKLKLAIDSGILDTVGIDLVAMCVNDLICNFASPMFFLDYYASAKLDIDDSYNVLKGIVKGCKIAGCSLLGGESAEMPSMYKEKDFDLAGFAVGIASKQDLTKNSLIKEGDFLLAFKSSGVHSNGFSLVRKLFFEELNFNFDDDFEGEPLIKTLLEPTRIYVKEFKKLKDKIKGIAHITGGGLLENIPRILPKGLDVIIEKKNIKSLAIFDFIKKYMDEIEFYRTFNAGVGLACVCAKENVDYILANSDAYLLGEIKNGTNKVVLI